MPSTDYDGLSVSDLRDLCKQRGLLDRGIKKDLIERLRTAHKSRCSSASSSVASRYNTRSSAKSPYSLRKTTHDAKNRMEDGEFVYATLAKSISPVHHHKRKSGLLSHADSSEESEGEEQPIGALTEILNESLVQEEGNITHNKENENDTAEVREERLDMDTEDAYTDYGESDSVRPGSVLATPNAPYSSSTLTLSGTTTMSIIPQANTHIPSLKVIDEDNACYEDAIGTDSDGEFMDADCGPDIEYMARILDRHESPRLPVTHDLAIQKNDFNAVDKESVPLLKINSPLTEFIRVVPSPGPKMSTVSFGLTVPPISMTRSGVHGSTDASTSVLSESQLVAPVAHTLPTPPTALVAPVVPFLTAPIVPPQAPVVSAAPSVEIPEDATLKILAILNGKLINAMANKGPPLTEVEYIMYKTLLEGNASSATMPTSTKTSIGGIENADPLTTQIVAPTSTATKVRESLSVIDQIGSKKRSLEDCTAADESLSTFKRRATNDLRPFPVTSPVANKLPPVVPKTAAADNRPYVPVFEDNSSRFTNLVVQPSSAGAYKRRLLSLTDQRRRVATSASTSIVAKKILDSLSDISGPFEQQRRVPVPIIWTTTDNDNGKQNISGTPHTSKTPTAQRRTKEELETDVRRPAFTAPSSTGLMTGAPRPNDRASLSTDGGGDSESCLKDNTNKRLSFSSEVMLYDDMTVEKGPLKSVPHESRGSTSTQSTFAPDDEFTFTDPAPSGLMNDVVTGEEINFVFSPPSKKKRSQSLSEKPVDKNLSLHSAAPIIHVEFSHKPVASVPLNLPQTTVNATSSVALSSSANPFAKFLNTDKLQCKHCLVYNDKIAAKCVSCENDMAVASGLSFKSVEIAKPPALGSIGIGGFSFGTPSVTTPNITSASSGGFLFGGASPTSTAVKADTTDAPNSGIVFGSLVSKDAKPVEKEAESSKGINSGLTFGGFSAVSGSSELKSGNPVAAPFTSEISAFTGSSFGSSTHVKGVPVINKADTKVGESISTALNFGNSSTTPTLTMGFSSNASVIKPDDAKLAPAALGFTFGGSAPTSTLNPVVGSSGHPFQTGAGLLGKDKEQQGSKPALTPFSAGALSASSRLVVDEPTSKKRSSDEAAEIGSTKLPFVASSSTPILTPGTTINFGGSTVPSTATLGSFASSTSTTENLKLPIFGGLGSINTELPLFGATSNKPVANFFGGSDKPQATTVSAGLDLPPMSFSFGQTKPPLHNQGAVSPFGTIPPVENKAVDVSTPKSMIKATGYETDSPGSTMDTGYGSSSEMAPATSLTLPAPVTTGAFSIPSSVSVVPSFGQSTSFGASPNSSFSPAPFTGFGNNALSLGTSTTFGGSSAFGSTASAPVSTPFMFGASTAVAPINTADNTKFSFGGNATPALGSSTFNFGQSAFGQPSSFGAATTFGMPAAVSGVPPSGPIGFGGGGSMPQAGPFGQAAPPGGGGIFSMGVVDNKAGRKKVKVKRP